MKKVISILSAITISMTSLVYADIGNEKNVSIEDNIETSRRVIKSISECKSDLNGVKEVPKSMMEKLDKTRELEKRTVSKSRSSKAVQEEPVFEQEPNNTYDKANKIEIEDSVIGEFGVYPDLDYFKFTVSESGEFYLLGNVSNSDFNPNLRIGLIDSDGKTVLLASSYIISSGGTYQMMQEKLVPGDYYIAVYQDYTQDPVNKIYSTSYSFITDFTPNTPEVSVESIVIDKPSITLNNGQSESLVATINPSDATDQDVIWTSSNTQVSTVDSYGLVTAVGKGTSTITATSADGSKSASSVVTVNDTEDNTSEYKTLPSKYDVPVDKVWTVKFNLPINKDTIKQKNIYVTDDNGKIMTMLYSQEKNKDNTIYLTPAEDYQRDSKYTLWIKALDGTRGQKLKKHVKMDFTITK